MSSIDVGLAVTWYIAFVISAVIHEASHAYTAMLGGDLTGYREGQVSLNPRPHIKREPFGMVLVPLLSFFSGGWMLGWASVPYDPRWAARFPRRAAWMSLAGPAANLALVLVSGGLIRLGMALDWFVAPSVVSFSTVTRATPAGSEMMAQLLSIFFTLNLILFVFNLLPVPPLDGSGVIQLLMGERLARRFQQLVNHPTLGLVGFLIAWYFFDVLFSPVHAIAINLLYPGMSYG